jgi:hypothetical protein
LSISTKSPVIAAFPSPGRLEVHHGDDPHAGEQRLSHLGDRFRPRHRDLEHAASDVPAGASEGLLDRFRIQGRAGRRCGSGRRAAEGRSTRRQRLAKRARHPDGVAVPPIVHVHHVRRHLVEVVVHGRDLEATGQEAGHRRGNLLVEQDEVSHDHRVVADLLERRIRAEGEPRLHRNALHRHGEIGARHPDSEHVARLHLTGCAERLLDGLPVGIDRVRGDWPGQRDDEGKHDNAGGAQVCLHRDVSFTEPA